MRRLLAEYDSVAALASAYRAASAAGLEVEETYAPVPWEVPDRPPSPVRRWVLVGGITGGLSGLALTIGTALRLPLIVGGKPIVSLPPFLVIAFELTILLGALGGVAGFLWAAGLPCRRAPSGYAPPFAVDRFGLVLRFPAGMAERAGDMLRQSGADNIVDLEDASGDSMKAAASGRTAEESE